MKHLALAAGIILVTAAPAHAQQPQLRLEIWGGYSILSAAGNDFPRGTSHGAAAGVAWRLTRWFSLAGEFGVQRSTVRDLGFNFPGIVARTRVVQFMAGPQFGGTIGRATLFVRTLVGGASGRTNLGGFSDTAFAMGAGAGVDIGLTRRLAVRGQLDWVAGFVDVMENDWRIGLGLVIRLCR